ncbi:hypothetical protein [Reinekea sp. G2M2-21]|uniref:hypothetical protein n=1 Tax=Reinekea sp. G2M2-21 TaxID=2788942 RepID=UPI0018AA9879|nr:hypothetical protein [Reinekea sp. G2M2-21]
MTVGNWEPGSEQAQIPTDVLLRALSYHDEHSFPEQPPEQLLPLQAFVKVTKSQWQPAFSELDSEQLKRLCRFFTLAEAHWSDWFGGDKNPVIWICKELKKRGEFPDKTLTAWIKENSDNRFLPYGNVLG